MAASEATTLFRARRVLTLDPALPTAEVVAVRAGCILGVGTAESLAVWGPAETDDRFAATIGAGPSNGRSPGFRTSEPASVRVDWKFWQETEQIQEDGPS